MKIQVNCRRCGGSGRFSFNLIRGTVCFGCNGVGVQMVDLDKEAKAKARSASKAVAEEARRAMMIAGYEAVIAEMNLVLGPFDTMTEKGVSELNLACAKRFGKGIAQIRDDRVAAMSA